MVQRRERNCEVLAARRGNATSWLGGALLVTRSERVLPSRVRRDLGGIVAKWTGGTYQSGNRTSWLKIKNSTYSQTEGRHELFEKRRPNADRARWSAPTLQLI